MDGTIIGQGSFLASNPVAPVIIQIPSGADWMMVMNYTQYGNIGTPATRTGVEFYWQLGMPNDTALVKYGVNAALTLNGDILTAGGDRKSVV